MNQITRTVALTCGTLAALCLALPPTQASEGFKVVVNAASPASTITRPELADLFLRKTANWKHGIPAVPVDQPYDGTLHRSFAETVIGKSQSALRSYWQQRIFSGRGVPPLALGSDQEVIDHVAKNKGAIGYVSMGASLTATVKTVTVQ